MLTRFWPVDDDWPPVRETIVRHSGIPKVEVVAALARLRRGEPRKRCWTIGSSTPSPLPAPRRIASLPQRNTVAPGVDELALTFAGSQPEVDMAYLG